MTCKKALFSNFLLQALLNSNNPRKGYNDVVHF